MLDWYEYMFRRFRGDESMCDALYYIAKADKQIDAQQMAYIVDMYVVYRKGEKI